MSVPASAVPKILSSLPASVTFLQRGVFHHGSRATAQSNVIFPELSLREVSTFALTHQTELLYSDLFCFIHSGSLGAPPPRPSGCVKQFGARCCQVYIFLVFPIFKQEPPPLWSEGMCANSSSPVGSVAITESLLYPRNCKGSCFPSDQPATREKGPITPGSADKMKVYW